MIHMGSNHRSVMARFVIKAPSKRDPGKEDPDERNVIDERYHELECSVKHEAEAVAAAQKQKEAEAARKKTKAASSGEAKLQKKKGDATRSQEMTEEAKKGDDEIKRLIEERRSIPKSDKQQLKGVS